MAGHYREGGNGSDSHRGERSPNVEVVDDHQHSGEVSASPFAPFRHLAFFRLEMVCRLPTQPIPRIPQAVQLSKYFVPTENSRTEPTAATAAGSSDHRSAARRDDAREGLVEWSSA
jgi:hypothetical protein